VLTYSLCDPEQHSQGELQLLFTMFSVLIYRTRHQKCYANAIYKLITYRYLFTTGNDCTLSSTL